MLEEGGVDAHRDEEQGEVEERVLVEAHGRFGCGPAEEAPGEPAENGAHGDSCAEVDPAQLGGGDKQQGDDEEKAGVAKDLEAAFPLFLLVLLASCFSPFLLFSLFS